MAHEDHLEDKARAEANAVSDELRAEWMEQLHAEHWHAHSIYNDAPDALKNDRAFALQAAKYDWQILRERRESGFLRENKKYHRIIPDKFLKDLSFIASLAIFHGMTPIKDSAFKETDIFKTIPPRHNGKPIITYFTDALRNTKEVALAAFEKDRSSTHPSKVDAEVVLECLSTQLQDDEDIVRRAIAWEGEALQYASERLRDDKSIVMEAVQKHHYDDHGNRDDSDYIDSGFKFASDALKNDKEVALKAVQSRGKALQFASDALKNDKEVVLAAVQQNGWALKYASPAMQADKEIVLAAIHESPSVFKIIGKDFKAAPEVTGAFADGCIFKNEEESWKGVQARVDEALLGDKDAMLAIVKKAPAVYKRVSDQLKNDKDVTIVAVSQEGGLLTHASPKMKANHAVVLAAVTNKGMALYYADKKLQDNKVIVLAAVTNDGDALEYASDAMKDDHKIVLAAVRQNPDALKFAGAKCKNDEEIVRAATQRDGEALGKGGHALRADIDFMLDEATTNKHAMKFSRVSREDWKILRAQAEAGAGQHAPSAEAWAHITNSLKKTPRPNRTWVEGAEAPVDAGKSAPARS